jgi:hypothetical protein
MKWISQWIPEATPDILQQHLSALDNNPDIGGMWVFAADGENYTPENLDPLLTALSKPVFGGVYPQVIWGAQQFERGAVVIGMEAPVSLAVIEDLSSLTDAPDARLIEAIPYPVPVTCSVALVVDGLSSGIARFITHLFNEHGAEQPYFGGGAGSLSLQPKPCVITPQGLLEDAAVVVTLPLNAGLGVSHGWRIISEAMKVTALDRNRIIEINHRPAGEVYSEIIAQFGADALTQENFFDIAKGFPFGVRRIGGEIIVRDPIQLLEDGSLVCVGELPPEAFVHVLEGAPDALIAAAEQARVMADSKIKPSVQRVFIDCISRVLFLQDQFGQELAAVAQDQSVVGALTLGEVAGDFGGFLEFYNKTAVVINLSASDETPVL